jgi:hypothetical protein
MFGYILDSMNGYCEYGNGTGDLIKLGNSDQLDKYKVL